MKIGVNLINFGPGATPEALLSWARLVEELGYHLLMTSDHVAVTPDVEGRYPAPFYEPLTVLGWLAGVTKRVELGISAFFSYDEFRIIRSISAESPSTSSEVFARIAAPSALIREPSRWFPGRY